jgi:hypothetical protein
MADATPRLSPPWNVIEASEDRSLMEAQAHREIGPGHVLERERLQAVGRRFDRDDVLFRMDDDRWVIVHLVWTPGPSADARWPTARIFATATDLGERLSKDTEEFGDTE